MLDDGNLNEWWRGAVIYQIYPRSFMDSDGDGIGDLGGIRDRLDHVAALGVDAIWISPFFLSPMRDFGYDVADYCAVDPMFGTLDDFDAVAAKAHGLGLRVLIDMVWSHTSDQHPWFQESRRDPRGPKADWYVWADARPDGMPPNNWLGVFGGGAWTWDAARRQYYLHHFLSEQPALNLRNAAVQDALLETGRFWLDRGVDGFRLDAIDFMAHDPSLRDNPARELDHVPTKPFGMQDHIHDMAHPDTDIFLRRARELLDGYPGAVAVAEVGSQLTMQTPVERAARYTDGGGSLLHTSYSLRMMKQPGTAEGLGSFIRAAEEGVGTGWLTWAFSNHDVDRVASRWGGDDPRAAKCYMALLLCLRGTICLYQGEELGLSEAEVPFEHLRDPFGLAYWPEFKGRDGCRTPMPWNAEEQNGGFSSAARPWLPLPRDHLDLSVSKQGDDADSVLQTTRHLLALRKRTRALQVGELIPFAVETPLLAFERRAGDGRILCLFNLSPNTVDVAAVLPEGLEIQGIPPSSEGRVPPWGVSLVPL